MNSAEVIERALWNVEIGGYAPHLPYSPAERGQFPGPRPLFTACAEPPAIVSPGCCGPQGEAPETPQLGAQ